MSGLEFLADAVLALALMREVRNVLQTRTFGHGRHVCARQGTSRLEVLIPASGESATSVADAQARFQRLRTRFRMLGTRGEPQEKPTLLNVAITRADHRITHHVIYDVDSSPTAPPEVMGCQVAQQLALYVTPRHTDSRGFWQGMADNQTLWAAGYESRSLDHSNVYYLVGHGLAVSRTIMVEQGGFRTGLPGEDIHLGYCLALRGIRPCRLPGLDICDAPIGWRRMHLQSERWFIGEVTALRDAAREYPGGGSLLLRRGLGLLFWMWGPWVVLAALWSSSAPVAFTLLMLLVRRLAWARVVRLGERRPVHWLESETRFLGFLVKPGASAVASLLAISRVIWRRGNLRHIERERRMRI